VRQGPSWWRLLVGFLQPALACGIMGLAVWLSEHGLVAVGLDHPAILLVVGIVVGALAYVISALVIARSTSRDLLRLVKRALVKRRTTGEMAALDPPVPPASSPSSTTPP